MSDMELDLQLVETTLSPVDVERASVRKEYRQRLSEKLMDHAFRSIDGLPIGTDNAILALSDPPYYTACPNPFIEEWVVKHGKPYDPLSDDYHREPFATDISEGKTDAIYSAHGYHTKVPHKAIMRYILHYTEPGDVVYDGFCGTGMTGVAAQMCGNKNAVAELGYRVDSNGDIFTSNSNASTNEITTLSKIGTRKAILNDLSPAATFIASNYNLPFDVRKFRSAAKLIIDELWKDIGWMYETLHTDGKTIAKINFTVWSEVFSCGQCGGEIVFVNEAFDKKNKSVRESFPCPHCTAACSKDSMQLQYESIFDTAICSTIQSPKRVPVTINYSIGKVKYEKEPDDNDLALLAKIRSMPMHKSVPTLELPPMQMTRVGRMQPAKITHIHHFFLPRAAYALATLWEKVNGIESDDIKKPLFWLIEQAIWGMSVLNRYSPSHFSQVNRALSGVFYVASQLSEVTPWYILDGKLSRIAQALENLRFYLSDAMISTGDCGEIQIPNNSVDYIFTDPPFGENIYYSDLNILVESWHKVRTNAIPEAIVDRVRGKDLFDYQRLMTKCFSEYYRVLKPGRWMTVEFHNSKNSVWNTIQEALQHAGFIVADVRTLDKQQGSFQQVSSASAVKQDLAITCYKARADFEEHFNNLRGEPQGAIEFIRQHLDMLPITPISKSGKIEVVAERTKFLLFDRMVAYHLQRNARIPMSSTEFYQMLNDQFVERDDMYFLQDQAAKYDALRARTDVEQLSIFIRDERSAVRWVRTSLQETSQTLGDLTPKFMQETREWDDHEPRPELRDILKENFIMDDNGAWRVPDPNQEKDLEALRRKGLLRTFEGYIKSKGQLKVFRKEAILEGFKHCWQTKQYGVIVAVCENIPAKTLQEVPEFMQFYDIAKDLAPAETQQLEFTWEG